MAVSLALLVAAGGLGLSATPVRADHTITVDEAVAATELSPDEFLAIFDNAELPGLGEIGPAPAITGDAELDARIRAIGEQRGYKRRPLPNRVLTQVDGHLLQAEAAAAWQALRATAREAGFSISLISAYRSEALQAVLYRRKASGTSEAAIDRRLQSLAVPGYTKHHTGYAIDVAKTGDDFRNFGNTRAYAWLAADNFANAKAHGWIPSYPSGSNRAGPNPEPWEFVWVGSTNIICGDFAPTPEHRFCDTVGSIFSADIDWLTTEGATTGCRPNRYCVDGDLTRAQAATLLWRYSGKPEPEVELPFVDVPPDSYYSQAAQWMFEQGLTTGTSATNFDPDRPISRAEFVTFLWRMASRPEPSTRTSPFVDLAPSSFFKKAVIWAVDTGITTLATNNPNDAAPDRTLPRFEVTATVTRGQTAAFIHRFTEHQSQTDPTEDADVSYTLGRFE